MVIVRRGLEVAGAARGVVAGAGDVRTLLITA
jgi:hypothetical protein